MGLLLFLLRLLLQARIIGVTARHLGEKGKYGFMLPAFDLMQPLLSLSWKWRARRLYGKQ